MMSPHAEIVKRRWRHYLAAIVVDNAETAKFIPAGCEGDPRLYIKSDGVFRRPLAILEKVANAAGLASKIDPRAQTAWKRDLREWIRGEQAATPEKIRQVCRWAKRSWIEGLGDAGYFQHLVYLIDKLAAQHDVPGAVAVTLRFYAGYFSQFDERDALNIWMYLNDTIPRIERRLPAIWPEGRIPYRVALKPSAHSAMRAAFRLCDGEDVRGQSISALNEIAFNWPGPVVLKHAAELIGIALEATINLNPYSAGVLKDLAAASYANAPSSVKNKDWVEK